MRYTHTYVCSCAPCSIPQMVRSPHFPLKPPFAHSFAALGSHSLPFAAFRTHSLPTRPYILPIYCMSHVQIIPTIIQTISILLLLLLLLSPSLYYTCTLLTPYTLSIYIACILPISHTPCLLTLNTTHHPLLPPKPLRGRGSTSILPIHSQYTPYILTMSLCQWQAVAIATSLVYVPYGELGRDVGSKNRWMCWGDKPYTSEIIKNNGINVGVTSSIIGF